MSFGFPVAVMADHKEYNPPEISTATTPPSQADSTISEDGLAEKNDSIPPSPPRLETQDCDGIDDVEYDLPPKKLVLTESYAIDTNADATAEVTQPRTKLWYRTPNPLRWGGIPPIPDEPIVSPEYKAGFLSRLTFGWITPMMVVSLHPIPRRLVMEANHLLRLATNANLTNVTFGK